LKKFTFLIFALSINLWAEEMSVKYSTGLNPQKMTISNAKIQTIQIELGEEIESILIHGVGKYKVFLQTETSLTVMDEGPHIDLINWKHGKSEFVELKIKDNEFLFVDLSKDVDFPKFTNMELVKAVTKEAGKRWGKLAKKCKTGNTDPCAIGPSKFIFKIQKEEAKDKFIDLGQIEFVPPMGC